MPTFDADSATCHVYSFKEGLLSRAGHDVKLEVGLFEITVAPGSVTATFDPATVRPRCAMRAGQEDHDALSDRDRRTIEGYVHDDILEAGRHPQIRFTSTSVTPSEGELRIEGRLELHGRTRPISVVARKQGDRFVARVKLRQTDYGIKPFSALLGALKIKSEVEVEVSVPATDLT